MFSRRTEWNPSPNQLTRLLVQKRAEDAPVLDLTVSNPTQCELPFPAEIEKVMSTLQKTGYIPEPLGVPEARESITADYARRGVTLPPEHLAITAGTSEAYSFLLRLLCDPGDSILAPAPTYPLFDLIARLNDVRLVPYTLVEQDGFSIDFESVERGLVAGARTLLAVNPGNPTGIYLRNEELTRLFDLCAHHEVPVVCDEVFGDFPLEETGPVPTAARQTDALVFVLNGISKMLALPQLKLAWIGVLGPDDLTAEAMRRLEVIVDTHLSTATAIQLALPALLSVREGLQVPILERIRANHALVERLASSGAVCHPLPVEGGWSTILKIPRVLTDEQWALRLLDQEDVLVHPGYFFDFPTEGHLVISLLVPGRVLEEGLSRLFARCCADS